MGNNENVKRVEVWFNDGQFRGFPNVTECEVYNDTNSLVLRFGDSNPQHIARINLNNVNFVEFMFHEENE